MTTTLNASPTATPHGVRLHTAADLAAMPDQLPSGPVKWELHHGRLVSMVLPGDEHGELQGDIVLHLKLQGDLRGHCRTRGEIGVVLRRNPDHIVGPDAAFIRASRLPPQRSPEGYLETMPDLVVEIRSPNDTLAALQRRADEFLAAGVVCVWVIDPIGRQVIESRSGVAPRAAGENDTLTLDDIIPGFALPVRDVLG